MALSAWRASSRLISPRSSRCHGCSPSSWYVPKHRSKATSTSIPNSSPASWAARKGDSVKTPPKSNRTASMGAGDDPMVVTVLRCSRRPIVGGAVHQQLLGQASAIVVGQEAVGAGSAVGLPPHLVGRVQALLLQRPLHHLVGPGQRHLRGDADETGRPLRAEIRLGGQE